MSEQLRIDSDKSFDGAVKEMIINLDEQLSRFWEKVKKHPVEYQDYKITRRLTAVIRESSFEVFYINNILLWRTT